METVAFYVAAVAYPVIDARREDPLRHMPCVGAKEAHAAVCSTGTRGGGRLVAAIGAVAEVVVHFRIVEGFAAVGASERRSATTQLEDKGAQ